MPELRPEGEPPRRPGRVRRGAVVLAAAGLLAAVTAAAQGPAPDSVLDGVVRTYEQAAVSWLANVIPMAMRTFALLATLEMAVSGLFWAVGSEGLDAVAAALLKKFIVLAFAFSLLSAFPLWLPYVMRGFEAAGQTASGTAVVNPGQILDYGITIGGHMLGAAEGAGVLTNPAGILIADLTAFVVLLAYALIAVQLCLTLCEVAFVLSGGALFLAFAGFRVTAPFAEGYLLYSVQTGIKVYLLYLLVGAGTGLSAQWAEIDFSSQGPATLAPETGVMTGALVLCLLVWRVGGISSRLAHSASFGLRDALR